MKTNILFSVLLVSSLVLTSACTPRDVKLSGDGVKGLGGPSGGKTQRNPEVFDMGNYAIASYIGERHVEVIELVKLATGSLTPVETSYSAEEGAVKDNGAKSKIIKSLTDTLTYVKDEEEWDAEANKSFDVVYSKDALVSSAEVTGKDIFSKANSASLRKYYVKSNDRTYSIKVSPDANPAHLKIEMNSVGTLSGAKGKDETVKEISLKIVMVVDAASLETSEVSIISANSIMFYPNPRAKAGDKNAIYSMPFSGTNLTVKLKAQCNSLTGKATSSAGPKVTFVTNFADTAISIDGKSWSNALAECGKRPTVELSRLHVF